MIRKDFVFVVNPQTGLTLFNQNMQLQIAAVIWKIEMRSCVNWRKRFRLSPNNFRLVTLLCECAANKERVFCDRFFLSRCLSPECGSAAAKVVGCATDRV